VFVVVYDGDGRQWAPYIIDGYGNAVSDVPSIQILDVRVGGGPTLALARRFRIFSVDGSSAPQVIVVQYEAFNFSGGAYAMFEICDKDDIFLMLGSMRVFHHSGAGPDAVSWTPFINKYGDIIVYAHLDDGFFLAINDEGNFEVVASVWTSTRYIPGDTIHIRTENKDGEGYTKHFTFEEFEGILADQEQIQSFFPNFPDGSFVRMKRMYELEQELIETITQRLRGTFTVAVQPANHES